MKWFLLCQHWHLATNLLHKIVNLFCKPSLLCTFSYLKRHPLYMAAFLKTEKENFTLVMMQKWMEWFYFWDRNVFRILYCNSIFLFIFLALTYQINLLFISALIFLWKVKDDCKCCLFTKHVQYSKWVRIIEEGLKQKTRQNVVVFVWGSRSNAAQGNFGVKV